jgi:hypothetical protein
MRTLVDNSSVEYKSFCFFRSVRVLRVRAPLVPIKIPPGPALLGSQRSALRRFFFRSINSWYITATRKRYGPYGCNALSMYLIHALNPTNPRSLA